MPPISICHPFQLLGIDFIGPLKATSEGGFTYILHVLCYFSLYSFTFPCEDANAEDVIKHLGSLFRMLGCPIAIYWDRGQHFKNTKVEDWLRSKGVRFSSSPSGSHKSTGMVEIGNRLLEDVLRRSMGAEHEWNKVLEKSTQALAHRVISYLGLTPAGILLGRKPSLAAVDDRRFNVMVEDIPTSVDRIQQPVVHVAAVRAHSVSCSNI